MKKKKKRLPHANEGARNEAPKVQYRELHVTTLFLSFVLFVLTNLSVLIFPARLRSLMMQKKRQGVA